MFLDQRSELIHSQLHLGTHVQFGVLCSRAYVCAPTEHLEFFKDGGQEGRELENVTWRKWGHSAWKRESLVCSALKYLLGYQVGTFGVALKDILDLMGREGVRPERRAAVLLNNQILPDNRLDHSALSLSRNHALEEVWLVGTRRFHLRMGAWLRMNPKLHVFSGNLDCFSQQAAMGGTTQGTKYHSKLEGAANTPGMWRVKSYPSPISLEWSFHLVWRECPSKCFSSEWLKSLSPSGLIHFNYSISQEYHLITFSMTQYFQHSEWVHKVISAIDYSW